MANSERLIYFMNRTDRLLAIVLELRLHGLMTAEALAKHFGTSKRTIYRDIQALSEAGVPVVALLGEGYRLSEGYFLPPLAFTEEEASLILLGLSAIGGSFDEDYRAKTEDARRKILGVLSDDTRQKSDFLEKSLLLGNMQSLPPSQQECLRLLRRAILNQQTVNFRYFSRYPNDGKVSLRDADPYSLACLDGIWFMSAYCHLRQDKRMFRLSRIEALKLTPKQFQRPENYDVIDEARHDERHLIVRVLFDEDSLPWLKEDQFFYITQREEHPEGLLVTLRVRHPDEVVQWLLGWGRNVRVLEPPELRQRLKSEAEALLKNHG
jgi:predicted DNA-binding transcriptional regulator YafY